MLTPHDRDIVTRTLIGEAIGEGANGMRAVAHVIANRVNAGFGATPADVSLAKSQFSAWNKGKGGNKLVYAYGPNSAEYKKAAAITDQVFAGGDPDPTNGATYYVNPKGTRWTPPGKKSATIGQHVFYSTGSVPPLNVGQTAQGKQMPLGAGRGQIHSGPAVSQLQQQLAAKGYDPGPIDGKYGPKTANAVRNFEVDNHQWPADSVAGPQVLAALNGPGGSPGGFPTAWGPPPPSQGFPAAWGPQPPSSAPAPGGPALESVMGAPPYDVTRAGISSAGGAPWNTPLIPTTVKTSTIGPPTIPGSPPPYGPGMAPPSSVPVASVHGGYAPDGSVVPPFAPGGLWEHHVLHGAGTGAGAPVEMRGGFHRYAGAPSTRFSPGGIDAANANIKIKERQNLAADEERQRLAAINPVLGPNINRGTEQPRIYNPADLADAAYQRATKHPQQAEAVLDRLFGTGDKTPAVIDQPPPSSAPVADNERDWEMLNPVVRKEMGLGPQPPPAAAPAVADNERDWDMLNPDIQESLNRVYGTPPPGPSAPVASNPLSPENIGNALLGPVNKKTTLSDFLFGPVGSDPAAASVGTPVPRASSPLFMPQPYTDRPSTREEMLQRLQQLAPDAGGEVPMFNGQPITDPTLSGIQHFSMPGALPLTSADPSRQAAIDASAAQPAPLSVDELKRRSYGYGQDDAFNSDMSFMSGISKAAQFTPAFYAPGRRVSDMVEDRTLPPSLAPDSRSAMASSVSVPQPWDRTDIMGPTMPPMGISGGGMMNHAGGLVDMPEAFGGPGNFRPVAYASAGSANDPRAPAVSGDYPLGRRGDLISPPSANPIDMFGSDPAGASEVPMFAGKPITDTTLSGIQHFGMPSIAPAGGAPSWDNSAIYGGPDYGGTQPGYGLSAPFMAAPAPDLTVSLQGNPADRTNKAVQAIQQATHGGASSGGAGPGGSPISPASYGGSPGSYSYMGSTPWGGSIYQTPSGGPSYSPYTPSGYTAPNFTNGSGGALYSYHPDGNGGGTFITSDGRTMSY